MIRIMLVDDHAAFRQALRLVLESDPDVQVVAEADSIESALGCLDGDVAVFDLILPDGRGTALLSPYRRARPRGAALMLTASTDPVAWREAVRQGAAAVMPKTVGVSEIVAVVRNLALGEPVMEGSDLARLAGTAAGWGHLDEPEEDVRLTAREREILQLLAEGRSNREIAGRLSISLATERTHITNILAKLGAHTQLQAVVIAIGLGFVSIGSSSVDRAHHVQGR